MNNKLSLGLATVVIIFGGYYFLGLKNNTSQANEMDPKKPFSQIEKPVINEIPNSTSPVNISMEGNEFGFVPNKIMVKKGQSVNITYKNIGKFPHNLVISQLNVESKIINPGQTDMIIFNADKTGKFEFICTIGNHADKGMTGEIVVE